MPFAGIVHHLSGPNTYAHTQTSLNCSVGCWCRNPSCHLHCASRLATCELAHVLDSLVRVSRRVEENHFVTQSTRLSPCKHRSNPAGKRREPEAILKHEQRLTHKLRNTTHKSMQQSQPEDWFHSLPFQQFQALLTLFSKSFSSFPHGTCLLTVSNPYLA